MSNSSYQINENAILTLDSDLRESEILSDLRMPAPWNGPTKPLTFEDAAADDLIWVNPATIEQVTSLIQDPARWIEELNGLDPDDKLVTLRKDFVLRLKLRGRTGAHGKDCIIQSIVGTNVLTVRPQVQLQQHQVENWLPYWEQWRDRGEMRVLYDVQANQAYVHLELTDKGDPAHIRGDKIAAFLMLAADPMQRWEGDYYLNHLLKKTPDHVTMVKDGIATVVEAKGPMCRPIPIETDPTRASKLLDINFTLIANQDELSSMPTGLLQENRWPPITLPPACDNMAGEWDPITGQIILDDIVVKNYA